MCGFTEPLFMDMEYVARESLFKRRAAPGALTFSLSEGLIMQTGLIHGTGMAWLGGELKVVAPVLEGDDTYAGALEEAGDLLIPMREGVIDKAHIGAELAELVTGRRQGRTGLDDITVFKSVGFALEDLAVAQLAYDGARARGIGKEVSL